MLRIRWHEFLFAASEAGSVETTKTSAPFCFASYSFPAVVEIATTLCPRALASLIPIVPRPPTPMIPMVMDDPSLVAPQLRKGSYKVIPAQRRGAAYGNGRLSGNLMIKYSWTTSEPEYPPKF